MSRRTLVRLLVAISVGLLFAVLTTIAAPIGLTSGVAELDSLRQQGQTRRNVDTAFTAADVSLDAPGRAVVHTRETWYPEIYQSPGGGPIRTTPAAPYAETSTVEFQDGSWIVTRNDT